VLGVEWVNIQEAGDRRQEAGGTHVLKRKIEAKTLCIALRADLLTRYASRYNSSFKLGFRPRKDSFNSYFFPPARQPSASCLLCNWE
jgi:hypothetical protein